MTVGAGPSEKDAVSAQKLGQLQPFIAVSSQECTGQLASFGGQPNRFCAPAPPGWRAADHSHVSNEEFWYIVEGEGHVEHGGAPGFSPSPLLKYDRTFRMVL